MKTTVWERETQRNKTNQTKRIYKYPVCYQQGAQLWAKWGHNSRGDCTQWRIHSHLKMITDQENFFLYFFVLFFLSLGSTAQPPQSPQIPPSWATSCLTKAYFYNNSIQAGSFSELQAGPESKIEQQRVSIIIFIIIQRFSTNFNAFFFFVSRIQEDWGAKWGCYIPTRVGWLDHKQIRCP